MNTYIAKNIVNNIKEHAEKAYPNECCGFFFGREDEDRHIFCSYRVANVKEGNQRRRFEIDGSDYRKAEKFADDNDLDFLGVYHTHPDHPAQPSEHDRSVAMPWFSYIIASVNEQAMADIRSWRLNEERQFEEEKLIAKEKPANQTAS